MRGAISALRFRAGWKFAFLSAVVVIGLFVSAASVTFADSGGSGHGKHGHKGKDGGGPPLLVPEAPYAVVFPIVIAGLTYIVYKKRSRAT